MFHSVTHAADATNTTTTYANIGTGLKFNCEEEEMWTQLTFTGVVSNNTIAEGVELDFLVDGVALAATPQAACANANLAASVDAKFPINMQRVVRLSKGFHTIFARFRRTANASTASLLATAYPAVTSALRLSNINVLAHGVDSKVGVTQ